MPSQPISRTASADATPSRGSHLSSNSDWEQVSIKREIEIDAESPVSEPLSPGAWVPVSSAPPSPATPRSAAGSNHNQPVPMSSAPANQYFLADIYRNGAYSDLEVVSAGVVRPVHRIIVCSESPVLHTMCSNLGPRQRLDLNQYDPETLDRVLDFCYRRTYSDGEYPETATVILVRQGATDIRDILETPLAVASDVQGWEGCLECDMPDETEEEQEYKERWELVEEERPDEAQDVIQAPEEPQNPREEQTTAEEQGQVEDADEYMPCSCDIHFSLHVDHDPSPRMPGQMELPQPPYAISLFANFKVYIAAKELQIPALQLVARERFAHSLQTHWHRFAEFPALIKLVYSLTDESDPIRMLVCQVVAASYDTKFGMAFGDEIRGLMAENGEFAAEVLDTTIRLRSGWTDAWE